jgi:hypothetical protein
MDTSTDAAHDGAFPCFAKRDSESLSGRTACSYKRSKMWLFASLISIQETNHGQPFAKLTVKLDPRRTISVLRWRSMDLICIEASAAQGIQSEPGRLWRACHGNTHRCSS